MSVVKVIPRANAILFEYPDGGSKTFLLSSYLTASAVGNNISVITAANEYALYKFPYTAVRDSTNTVFSGTAAGTVTALNNLFGLTETDVDQLKLDFDDLNGRALDNTSLITDLFGVEKFTTTKGDYLLVAGDTTNGEVKTKAPATFISENSIVVNSSSPNFVEVSANTYYLGTASNGIVYEGTTVDNFETTIKAINPTADRTINFPDASGTVALVGATTNLDDLADVIITDPLDHDSLVYDEGTGDWINGTPKALDMPVYNGSGAIISKGALCKAIGTHGDRVSVGLFDLDVDDPKVLVGLATAQLAIAGTGHVRTYGELRGISTDAYTVGTILYASGTAGTLSSTAGIPELAIAIVTRSQQNTGRLFIRSWTPNSGKAFRYVTAGGNTLEAEKQEDTLTLTAAGGMTITSVTGTDTITLDSARLDDNDVTLSGVREIDLNGENLNIVNGALEILRIESDGVRQANTVIADYGGTVGGKITLAEATANGGNSIAIQAPASIAASTTYTLPSADGTSGQVLATDSTGGLSWATRSSLAFSTIAVSGQSNVVADSASDTLTLAPSNANTTITTDAGTDTVTIGIANDVLFTSVNTTGNITALGAVIGTSLQTAGNINASGTLNVGTAVVQTLSFIGGGTTTIGPDNSLPTDPSDLLIRTNGNCDVVLDYDNDEASQAFRVKDGAGAVMFSVDEDGISVANGTASTGAVIRLGEATANGTNYVAVQAAASLAANTTYTLPTADGTSGQLLSTNGSGTLSWATRKATQVTGITVATGAWSLVSGFYEASISDAAISATSIVDVIPDNASAATVRTAEVLPRTDSSAGAVKIYANNIPAATITVSLIIIDL